MKTKVPRPGLVLPAPMAVFHRWRRDQLRTSLGQLGNPTRRARPSSALPTPRDPSITPSSSQSADCAPLVQLGARRWIKKALLARERRSVTRHARPYCRAPSSGLTWPHVTGRPSITPCCESDSKFKYWRTTVRFEKVMHYSSSTPTRVMMFYSLKLDMKLTCKLNNVKNNKKC